MLRGVNLGLRRELSESDARATERELSKLDLQGEIANKRDTWELNERLNERDLVLPSRSFSQAVFSEELQAYFFGCALTLLTLTLTLTLNLPYPYFEVMLQSAQLEVNRLKVRL